MSTWGSEQRVESEYDTKYFYMFCFVAAEYLVLKTIAEYGFNIEFFASLLVPEAFAKAAPPAGVPAHLYGAIAAGLAGALGILMAIAAWGAWIAKPPRKGALELLKTMVTFAFMMLSGLLGVTLTK